MDLFTFENCESPLLWFGLVCAFIFRFLFSWSCLSYFRIEPDLKTWLYCPKRRCRLFLITDFLTASNGNVKIVKPMNLGEKAKVNGNDFGKSKGEMERD